MSGLSALSKRRIIGAAETVASEEERMTEDDLEAETRLLLATSALRDAKYPWLMFVPASTFMGAKP